MPRLCSNKNRKNGAPTIAVTMPRGSSAGATIVRQSMSATRISEAPRSAHAGSNSRRSGLIARRNICGTTMPMKPIIPLTDTAVPTANATIRMIIRFSHCTETPRCRACLSPRTSASNPRATKGTNNKTLKIRGMQHILAARLLRPSLPST